MLTDTVKESAAVYKLLQSDLHHTISKMGQKTRCFWWMVGSHCLNLLLSFDLHSSFPGPWQEYLNFSWDSVTEDRMSPLFLDKGRNLRSIGNYSLRPSLWVIKQMVIKSQYKQASTLPLAWPRTPEIWLRIQLKGIMWWLTLWLKVLKLTQRVSFWDSCRRGRHFELR